MVKISFLSRFLHSPGSARLTAKPWEDTGWKAAISVADRRAIVEFKEIKKYNIKLGRTLISSMLSYRKQEKGWLFGQTFLIKNMVIWIFIIFLCSARVLAINIVHTTVSDFRNGYFDGNVDINSDSGGTISLAKRGGTVEPFLASDILPNNIYSGHGNAIAKGYLFTLAGLKDFGGYADSMSTVYSAPLGLTGDIGAWSEVNSLPVEVLSHCTVSAGEYIYIIGGYIPAGMPWTILDSVYSAKVNANGTIGSWASLAPLPEKLYIHQAVLINGYIYVLGGMNEMGTGTQSAVYSAKLKPDGSLENWIIQTSLPKPLLACSAVSMNRYLYILGGTSGGALQFSVYSIKVNADGTFNGSWNTLTNMPKELSSLEAIGSNGYIFVTGGYGGLFQSAVYSAMVNKDGTIGNWATLNALYNNVPVVSHQELSVNQYLLILGGNTASNIQTGKIVLTTKNSDLGYYNNYFLFTEDHLLNNLTWQGNFPENIQVRYRTADHLSGEYSDWSEFTSTPDISINTNAGYFEYQIEFNGSALTQSPEIMEVSLSYDTEDSPPIASAPPTVPEKNLIKIYPNPYIKGRTPGNEIRFCELNGTTAIKIFAMTGELVKQFNYPDGSKNEVSWDVSKIASGVYFYYLYTDQKITKGKIAIIK